MKLTLPAVWAIELRHNDNLVKQLHSGTTTVDGNLVPYTRRSIKGLVFKLLANPADEILIVNKKTQVPESFAKCIRVASELDANVEDYDCSEGVWLRHPAIGDVTNLSQLDGFAQRALDSWSSGFEYIREDPQHQTPGLRNPQIGALHMILGHWSVSEEVATIVMPTGTGKTETMLSLLLAVRCPRVLVVVPTDALRTQISEKFLTLGILKAAKVAGPETLYPVVGIIKHRPTSQAEVDELFATCNVVVTTSQIAGQCAEEIRQRFAFHCDYLFIDEAHHVEARTWRALKDSFASRKILQFTATPFREDDQVLDGKIIYKYPLRRAQQEGYFQPIHFKSIIEFDATKVDGAIAEAAIAALREDQTGKHVLMARVDSIPRAKEVFQYYKDHVEFQPIELHSGIKSQRILEENRSKLISGQSRIVVCVDMLGEGFDLPELKIAAFHDIRKSLAVTLQIAGRFTRSRSDLGNATFIANVGDVDVKDELKKLYAQDPDWNVLLPELSEQIIGEQIEVRHFNDGFTEFPSDIPLRTFRPATSTVVYKTTCANWQPRNFTAGIDAVDSYARLHYSINEAEKTLIVVTAQQVPIEWAELDELFTLEWGLLIVIWDRARQHLYINSSTNRGVYKRLAQAVAGENVQLIKEPEVFRCFGRIKRLRLSNVGLTQQIARLISFTGRMGSDVKPALTDAQKRNTRKAVLFGSGFEDGQRTTVGASRRGRVWSFRRVRLSSFAGWCKSIGDKLADGSIDPNEVLETSVFSEAVESIPKQVPIFIDWPEEFYKETEAAISFFVDGDGGRWPLYETGIELTGSVSERSIAFRLVHETENLGLTLTLTGTGDEVDYEYRCEDGRSAKIGNRSARTALTDFFYECPPPIWFANGSSLEGSLFTPLNSDHSPFDRSRIEVIDWSGVNMKTESMGMTKDPKSIQYRVVQHILSTQDRDIVFDDDYSGEVADVVAIKSMIEGKERVIAVDLYHCKYAREGEPRALVEDLYEVCGQAQKCVSWCYPDKQVDLFSHLLRREPKRYKGEETTRFHKGTKQDLLEVREMSKTGAIRARVFVVQPGLSKKDASDSQLALLAVTENYLAETSKVGFGVIGSL